MGCRLLPSSCYFAHVGVLCTFSQISAAAEARLARSWRLSRTYTGQAVQYIMAGGTALLPLQYKSSFTLPSPPARQGMAPCWVTYPGPSASVVVNEKPCKTYWVVRGARLREWKKRIQWSWARICKRLRSPGIDSARQAGNRFLGSLKGLQIRALAVYNLLAGKGRVGPTGGMVAVH